MVTRGSWVTPHTMEAWVPLMTLWSCGGLVMRVRAERQQGGGRVGRCPRRTGEMQVCVGGVLPVSRAVWLRSAVDWSPTANVPEH